MNWRPKESVWTRLGLPVLAIVCSLVFFGLVVAGTFIKSYGRTFVISSGSMIPSLLVNDRVLADTHAYARKLPAAGDIIVYKSTEGEFVQAHRVVGLPGDTVAIDTEGQLWVNGKRLEKPSANFSPSEDDIAAPRADVQFFDETTGKHVHHVMLLRDVPRYKPGYRYGLASDPFKVPEGNVFVMGDNRDNAKDSRYVGPIPIKNILGKVTYIYWSQLHGWDRFSDVVNEETK